MNFEIFDDDFAENKEKYKKEILALSKKHVLPNMEKEFLKFVDEFLTGTRNYYIILFALKTMENISNGDSYEFAPLKAFVFMPDLTLFQTMCMVAKKYLIGGEELANFYNVEIEAPKKKFSKKIDTLKEKKDIQN